MRKKYNKYSKLGYCDGKPRRSLGSSSMPTQRLRKGSVERSIERESMKVDKRLGKMQKRGRKTIFG